jgi:APA family basic amino acid/polyamine antiporter
MGLHRQVPDRLRQLHPKFSTPWIGIIVFGAIACVTIIPGQAVFLGNMYAFGAMLSFTIAHASVVRLRLVDPDRARPYRGPGNIRIAGRQLPVFALLGGTGTFLAFVTVTALHLTVAAAGVGWLALGVGVYVVYRRNQHLDLVTTTKVAVQRPATERDTEYETVLVAFTEHGYAREVMATAGRIAARRRGGIRVLVTIEVPSTSPIDALMPEQEAAAQSLIEEAKVQVGRGVSGQWVKVRAGQTGRRIVQEAREMSATAIVMPVKGGPGGGLSRTLETVLRERPCRVILESSPEPPARRAA